MAGCEGSKPALAALFESLVDHEGRSDQQEVVNIVVIAERDGDLLLHHGCPDLPHCEPGEVGDGDHPQTNPQSRMGWRMPRGDTKDERCR